MACVCAVAVFQAWKGTFWGQIFSKIAPGLSCHLLASARFSSVLLGPLLGSPRFSSVLLGSPRFSSALCSVLLGSPRFCSVLLGLLPGMCSVSSHPVKHPSRFGDFLWFRAFNPQTKAVGLSREQRLSQECYEAGGFSSFQSQMQ